MTTNWLNVGKIVNTHGIAGEVRVISSTDFPEERYLPGKKLYLFMPKSKEPIELTIQTARQHKNFYLLKFEKYGNINLVEPFKTGILKVSGEQLFDLAENEFYYFEIVGCEVISETGEMIGEVKEILSPGANDVWVVQTVAKKEVLIPYIEDVVKEIDVDAKKIVIHVMEGLLD